MLRLLLLADAAMLAITVWRYTSIPDEIPLFYSRPWGDAQLVEYWYILLLPLIMHFFYFLNQWLEKKYAGHNHLISRILIIMTYLDIVVFTSIYIRILILIT